LFKFFPVVTHPKVQFVEEEEKKKKSCVTFMEDSVSGKSLLFPLENFIFHFKRMQFKTAIFLKRKYSI